MIDNKKHDKINIDENINKVEKWFTDHQRDIGSTFKMLNSGSKSTQLILSTQFHEILKKMRKDSTSCRLLNSLLTSNQLKVKNTYLADNNINALAANIDSEGDATLSYADIKTIMQKEVGMVRNYTDLEKLLASLKKYKDDLELQLPIIYNKVYSTPENRENLFINTSSVHNESITAFSNMVESHESFARELIHGPARERFRIDHASVLFTYISIAPETSLLVKRITKCMLNFIQNTDVSLTPEKRFKEEYPQYEDVQKKFKDTLIKSDIVWNVFRDVTYYYEKDTESLIEVLEMIRAKRPLDVVYAKIEEYNTDNMINMLAVVESNLKFFNAILEASKGDCFNSNGGLRDFITILKREGMLSYEFNKIIKSLGVMKHFPSLGHMYISCSDFKETLAKNYKNYLNALYKSNFREQCKIGKISSKLYNRYFTAVEVEDFTNLFKKQMIVNNILHDIRIIEGPLLSYYYNEHVYAKQRRDSILAERLFMESRPTLVATDTAQANPFIDVNMDGGSLQYSCMRYPHRLKRTKLYADNPNTYKMLVALDDQGRLKARAILEYHKDGKVYIDRVYASIEKVRLEMFTWAEQRGFISLHRTNGSYKESLKYTSDNNLVLELEKPIYPDTPYLDSMKIQSHIGIMAKKDLSDIEKVTRENKILEDRTKKSTRQITRLLDLEMVEEFSNKAVAKSYTLSKNYYDLDINTKMQTEYIEKSIQVHPVWGAHEEKSAHDVHTMTISIRKKKKILNLPVLENNIKLKFEKKLGRDLNDLLLGRLIHTNIDIVPDRARAA